MTLPTSDKTTGYYIHTKTGYKKLVPHSEMLGWKVATVTVAEATPPYTITMNGGQPIVGNGAGMLPHPLPAWDDLVGVRIVQVLECDDSDDGCDHKDCVGKICDKILDKFGCNAGFALLALLAVCGVFLRRK
jgi:hypothetical protein